MILIACVEDRMGMMFNHRRVSRDKTVNQDILDMCRGKTLYMEEYSVKLFEGMEVEGLLECIRTIEEIPSEGLRGEYFFAENPRIIQENTVEKIVLYRWNRRYPADKFFPVNLNEWDLRSCEEFAGNSHEKITKEIYERK